MLGEIKYRKSQAFALYPYAVAGMRTIADRGRLTGRYAKVLLEKTERQALQFGNDEFYKSIGAVAVSGGDAVPALLEFVEGRLLQKQDILDWRYLVFVAVAAIAQYRPSFTVPDELKNIA
jgi:urease accessory protein UreE